MFVNVSVKFQCAVSCASTIKSLLVRSNLQPGEFTIQHILRKTFLSFRVFLQLDILQTCHLSNLFKVHMANGLHFNPQPLAKGVFLISSLKYVWTLKVYLAADTPDAKMLQIFGSSLWSL